MLLDWIDGDPATEAMQNAAQPINRMASPEEIAHVAVWLCSDSASYITGAIVMADGGMTAVSGGRRAGQRGMTAVSGGGTLND